MQLASTSVLKNSDQIFKVRQASSDIFAQSDNLLKGLDRLSWNNYSDDTLDMCVDLFFIYIR